jgi:hypothetical protein
MKQKLPSKRIRPSGNPKADRKFAHRERKHEIINAKVAELRKKYIGMTAAQRAAEARQHADRVLSEMRLQAQVLEA